MSVLKILFIILGIILGILLFLLLAVLFCPIRYKVSGQSLEETYINAKVTWFLSSVGVHFLYDTDGSIRLWLRILCWKKMLMDQQKEQTDKESTVENYDSGTEFKETHQQKETAKTEHVLMEENDFAEDERETAAAKKNRKKNPGKNIKDMIDRIKKFDFDEGDKAAFSHLKEELVRFLKHVCPKKSRMNLTYSTGAPDTTGISLGVIAMFPLAYQNHWNIVPDFEAETAYAKGNGWLKGRIYVYFLLGIFVRIFRDKNCIRLYRKIKEF